MVSFRSDCVYQAMVYYDTALSRNHAWIQDTPSTPGGMLSFRNGQTMQGSNLNATFRLLEGGSKGYLQVEWADIICRNSEFELIATVDSLEFLYRQSLWIAFMGPHLLSE